VGREEHDPQAFWMSVLDSLRGTRMGSERVRELTAAPDLDGATIVRRLLEDVGSLDESVWLVLDDLHDLHDEQVIRQIELLLGSAPPQLRLVLLTRRDLRLGLHRLRLEGELTEIRGKELRFTVSESRALLEAAGVRLSDGALESLVGTTEGWVADRAPRAPPTPTPRARPNPPPQSRSATEASSRCPPAPTRAPHAPLG